MRPWGLLLLAVPASAVPASIEIASLVVPKETSCVASAGDEPNFPFNAVLSDDCGLLTANASAQDAVCHAGSGQASWLAWLESDAAASQVLEHYTSLYGQPLRAVDVPQLNFLWDALPRREEVTATWKCFTCSVTTNELWAPFDDALKSPMTLPAGSMSACGDNRTAQLEGVHWVVDHYGASSGVADATSADAPYRACLVQRLYEHIGLGERMEEAGLRFPGVFVQRLPHDGRETPPLYRLGVPNDTWVEVIRIARLDDKFKPNDEATASQVWYWVAMGSGIWLNVGRTLVHFETYAADDSNLGEVTIACVEARAMGYDTVQFPQSMRGFSFELLDCRGHDTPIANDTWINSCPPPHTTLMSGLPSPRYAPALTSGRDDLDERAWPCSCDCSLYHLNCAPPPGLSLAKPTSTVPASMSLMKPTPTVPGSIDSRASLIGTPAAAAPPMTSPPLHHFCAEAQPYNDAVAAPFTDFASSGLWMRALEDFYDFDMAPAELEARQWPSRRCPWLHEVFDPTTIPPWCPSQGDLGWGQGNQVNTTQMQRYAYSFVSTGICWRQNYSKLRSVIYGPSMSASQPHKMRGGAISFADRLAPRALCYYPRDAGSAERNRCGCGDVPVDQASSADVACRGDLATMHGADSDVGDYVRAFHERAWVASAKNVTPSMDAALAAKVMSQQRSWQVPPTNGGDAAKDLELFQGYNEIIIRPWWGRAFADVPIDAWLYWEVAGNASLTRRNCRFMAAIQRSYNRLTGRKLPLFRIDTHECNSHPLSCVDANDPCGGEDGVAAGS